MTFKQPNKKRKINLLEKNRNGSYTLYGDNHKKTYYGYSKKEAMRRFRNDI